MRKNVNNEDPKEEVKDVGAGEEVREVITPEVSDSDTKEEAKSETPETNKNGEVQDDGKPGIPDSDSNEDPKEDDDSDTPASDIATVANCDRLNVRTQPNKEGKVLCILDKGDLLGAYTPINDEWLNVITSTGIEGFVMKEFIEIV